ncbi:MAG: excinuclease ABC subunit UvrA [Candidatus Edwardsbacteria bacterium]|nr:excinuclease ABC subunit UvrA [Candidatus Edwardsbacteria bacterium]MBU2463950.1 excinuclease ABC subunit UvrA [Candidatus Edwardsbacteria bacterium]MBU2593496.1 excinuclease ABC subunit UvrA [Candidatus Edwardsbacteria bacterium]
MRDKLIIKGAREHNLKNISLEIPRDKLVVITGLSGSGKSSLAFDTIYAEGQRRYVESLSAYARQFLGLMEKPDVDFIDGLSPAIAIEQRSASKNPRSTVGTVTEIHDYLRLLFARIGKPHCPHCGRPITSQTVQQITDDILTRPEGAKVQLLAPLVRGRKGEYKDIFDKMRREGFVRVRVDGKLYEIEAVPALDKNKKHQIEAVVDRLAIGPKSQKRLADSLEIALKLADGLVTVIYGDSQEQIYSEKLSCPDCKFSFAEMTPRMFSFNSPFGACPACSGLGTKMEIDPEALVPNPDLTINEGAVMAWGDPMGHWIGTQLEALSKTYKFSLDLPWKELTPKARQTVLYGTDKEIKVRYESENNQNIYQFSKRFEGAIPNLMRRYKETESDYIRYDIEKYMSILPCPSCNGARLKPETLAVKVLELNINDISRMSVKQAKKFFGNGLDLSDKDRTISRQILKELTARLGFLVDVGLDYLTLDRSSESLAGGEAQRIHLATQIGASLTGVLYVLDEPSIGLHQRDNIRLLNTLTKLRDLGNTVLVVEHDKETMLAADHIVDLGPGAGASGGQIVAQGTPAKIMQTKTSLTGQYLAGKRHIPTPAKRRKGNGLSLIVRQASENNLKDIDVEFPLAKLIGVTGVSGSGKSTLVNDILYRALAQKFTRSRTQPGKHRKIEGLHNLDKVINIDQSPIGRTPRSNPATYTGLFTYLRELFAMTQESKLRGYKVGRFSFNVKGGRCEACEGDGIVKIEMHFLPDVYVPCEVCKGKRYNRETMEVAYKGKNISEVLEMTVDQAMEFFEAIPKIHRKLRTLADVGLGYIHLGQSATTLSGGEAQRVKLASELSKIATGKTLYILDEPTTGLHFEDVKMLLTVLQRLVDKGNTVIVIEHNLDVVKSADWIIDLGPEGGDQGGSIMVQGTPEKVAAHARSYTGQYLKKEM